MHLWGKNFFGIDMSLLERHVLIQENIRGVAGLELSINCCNIQFIIHKMVKHNMLGPRGQLQAII